MVWGVITTLTATLFGCVRKENMRTGKATTKVSAETHRFNGSLPRDLDKRPPSCLSVHHESLDVPVVKPFPRILWTVPECCPHRYTRKVSVYYFLPSASETEGDRLLLTVNVTLKLSFSSFPVTPSNFVDPVCVSQVTGALSPELQMQTMQTPTRRILTRGRGGAGWSSCEHDIVLGQS